MDETERKQRRKEQKKQWELKNPERRKEITRAWYRRNAETVQAKQRLKYDPRQNREWWLLRQYGISIESYEALLMDQGGGCPVCGRPGEDGDVFDVDHDHRCCPGKGSCGRCVRGALCRRHNQALGLFQDDPMELERAMEYLALWKVRHEAAN